MDDQRIPRISNELFQNVMKQSIYTHWNIRSVNVDISAQSSGKTPMTFIMGARCVDGVVLVADTKVMLSDYSEFDHQKNCLMESVM